jgi:uncharacterized protein (TIGR02145 family)
MIKKYILLFAILFFTNQISSQVVPQGFIGTQVWMKYNLDVETYQDGTNIERANLAFSRSVVLPSWCYYNYDIANDNTYGKLYNGYAVNDSRNICPVGFRIPTRAEFATLNTYLGANAGGKLKEAGNSHWVSPNTGATNSSGFTGLPGGYMGDAGSSSNIGVQGYFWTATSAGSTNYIRYLRSADANFTESNAFVLAGGASVRCIKN